MRIKYDLRPTMVTGNDSLYATELRPFGTLLAGIEVQISLPGQWAKRTGQATWLSTVGHDSGTEQPIRVHGWLVRLLGSRHLGTITSQDDCARPGSSALGLCGSWHDFRTGQPALSLQPGSLALGCYYWTRPGSADNKGARLSCVQHTTVSVTESTKLKRYQNTNVRVCLARFVTYYHAGNDFGPSRANTAYPFYCVI